MLYEWKLEQKVNYKNFWEVKTKLNNWSYKQSGCCWERADCTALSGIAVPHGDTGWLFQTWKLWQFTRSQLWFIWQIVLMSMVQELVIWGDRVDAGVESCKIMFLWGTSYSLVQTFLLMYNFATMHNITDSQMDTGQKQYQANSLAKNRKKTHQKKLPVWCNSAESLKANNITAIYDSTAAAFCYLLKRKPKVYKDIKYSPIWVFISTNASLWTISVFHLCRNSL